MYSIETKQNKLSVRFEACISLMQIETLSKIIFPPFSVFLSSPSFSTVGFTFCRRLDIHHRGRRHLDDCHRRAEDRDLQTALNYQEFAGNRLLQRRHQLDPCITK